MICPHRTALYGRETFEAFVNGLTDEAVAAARPVDTGRAMGIRTVEAALPEEQVIVFDADKAALKAQISERDEALKKLKESTKDSAELQAKIAELEKASKESKEKYEAEITASKQKYAFDTALAGYKPKNAKALEALIDKARITYADDGKGGFTITGLKEQVEALRKDEGYLFEDGSSTSPNPQNPPSNPKPDTGKLDKYFGL